MSRGRKAQYALIVGFCWLLGTAAICSGGTLHGFKELPDNVFTGSTVRLVTFDSPQDTGEFPAKTFQNVTFTACEPVAGDPTLACDPGAVHPKFTIGHDFNGQYNTSGVNSLFNGFDFVPHAFYFTFSNPVSFFAFNWGAADNTWILTVFSGGQAGGMEVIPIPPNFGSDLGDFWGATTTGSGGIQGATLIDQKDNFPAGDYVFIDNFTYACINQTGACVTAPEPTSLALLASGLVGLIGLAWKRQHPKQSKRFGRQPKRN